MWDIILGYNSVLYEDQSTNRMEECYNLFKQTVNNPMFSNTPVLLVFNKKDLFEHLIAHTPLSACPTFRDYQPPVGEEHSTMKALEFITAKFRSAVQGAGGAYCCEV